MWKNTRSWRLQISFRKMLLKHFRLSLPTERHSISVQQRLDLFRRSTRKSNIIYVPSLLIRWHVLSGRRSIRFTMRSAVGWVLLFRAFRLTDVTFCIHYPVMETFRSGIKMLIYIWRTFRQARAVRWWKWIATMWKAIIPGVATVVGSYSVAGG